MVTQDQHFAEQVRLKKRNKAINADLAHVNEELDKAGVNKMSDIRDAAIEAYHLGMDMGIRIGKDEL